MNAIVEGNKDVILIAKTGYGKSMVFHSIPALVKNTVAVILMPLNALQDDQIDSIRKLKIDSNTHMNPCVLNGETKTPALLKAIRRGEYTHILTSPEMALGFGPNQTIKNDFRAVLSSADFQDRLSLLAIDEAHIIEAWGHEFRKAYSRIGELRSILPRTVPFFATSATLDDATLRKVTESLRFREDNLLIKRESLDRDDLFFNIQAIRDTFKSFQDLRFLIEPQDDKLLKQVVYGGSITELMKMTETLRGFQQETTKCAAEKARTVIRIYHSEMSALEKKLILDEFKKTDSVIRIICATDALEMGINISDIDRVCQWREPPSLRELMQRGGRAARQRGHVGEVIYFYSPVYLGERSPSQGPGPSRLRESQTIDEVSDEASDKASQISEREDTQPGDENPASAEKKPVDRKRKQTKAKCDDYQRRKDKDDGLHNCINVSDDGCIRREILEYFSSSIDTITSYPNGCCNKCHPDKGTSAAYLDQFRKQTASKPKRTNIPTKRYHRGPCINKLHEWRQRVGPRVFAGTMSIRTGCFNFFLSQEVIK